LPDLLHLVGLRLGASGLQGDDLFDVSALEAAVALRRLVSVYHQEQDAYEKQAVRGHERHSANSLYTAALFAKPF
jgi:hypothetical protein